MKLRFWPGPTVYHSTDYLSGSIQRILPFGSGRSGRGGPSLSSVFDAQSPKEIWRPFKICVLDGHAQRVDWAQ